MENRPVRQRSWLYWCLCTAMVLALIAVWQRPNGQLQLVFPAVAGDALLIRAPNGAVSLIDGGADPLLLAVAAGHLLPFYERQLHALIVTAPTNARLVGSTALLSRYRARLALAPPSLGSSAIANEWQRLIAAQRVPRTALQAGQAIELGAGVALHILAHDESGVALLIQHHTVRVALVSGAASLDDPAAQAYQGPLDALIIPWDRELSPALHAAWQPRAIIYSDGYHDDHPPTRSFFERAPGVPSYHEAIDGDLRLVSDGRQLSIETHPP